jgi:hypothetical protein
MTMTQGMASGTQSSAAAAAVAAINSFLAVAPTKYTAILGTVAAGLTGGAAANVIWQQQIPIVPAFCTAIDYEVTLPLTYTATTVGGAFISPFAPYSVIANQLTLGGAPPWPLTEMLPWYLDYVAKHLDYDFSYPGLGYTGAAYGANEFLYPGAPATYTPTNGVGILDSGPNPNLFPAGAIPNAALTTAAVSNAVLQFKIRQQLQRKRHLLWGAIPFGDPENRPNNLVQLLPFTGVNPEQTLIVTGSTTAFSTSPVIGTGGCTVKATYELAYIDLLPPSMTSVPNPQVGYALQLIQFSTTNLAAGTIFPITHRTAMAYTAIHQLLINGAAAGVGGIPYRADYFGLWDDQDQQSSRWNFDAQNNTFTEYFDRFHRVYHHYPLTGYYLSDFEGGLFPEIPSLTPYDAIMSPDSTYAAAFGVPVTPAMTTSLRLPTGTTAINPYVRTYAFGLVRVPY